MNRGALLKYLRRCLGAPHACCVGFAMYLRISLRANCASIRSAAAKLPRAGAAECRVQASAEIGIFFSVLGFGLVYLYQRGGLEWD